MTKKINSLSIEPHVLWSAYIIALVGAFGLWMTYVEYQAESLLVKRGDVVHFTWTKVNRFYSSQCTDYGTAIDIVGEEKAYKVVVSCVDKGRVDFVVLVIPASQVVSVDPVTPQGVKPEFMEED